MTPVASPVGDAARTTDSEAIASHFPRAIAQRKACGMATLREAAPTLRASHLPKGDALAQRASGTSATNALAHNAQP
ncbi:hypothetical protein [uncultured Nostoc sp.]|uniref:hypothetical protein n=1 Tax=uncultured Nostoc sp. TaxID=340711 RepID=UPI0035CB0F4C